jgi:hypothetical protein
LSDKLFAFGERLLILVSSRDVLLNRQEVGDFAPSVAQRRNRFLRPIEFAALLPILDFSAPFAAAANGFPETAI